MKKIISFVMCLLAISSTISASSSTTVLLQHGENVTLFDADKIGEALEAAEDGDVIYLNEGTYPAFNITKKVCVKGVGELSIIDGNIDIAIPDKQTLSEPIFEYLYIKGLVSVNKEITGIKFKQCNIGGIKFNAKINDAYIDRCRLSGYTIASTSYGLYNGETYTVNITANGASNIYKVPYVKGLTITNSYISGINCNRDCQNTNYINCEIYKGYTNTDYWITGGTFINSITGGMNLSDAKLVNSSYSYNYNNTCDVVDCYKNETLKSGDTKYLQSNGYLGNDGTIIGVFGGNTPFTLIPNVPKVTNSSLKVDTKKQELNVTLSVSPK